MDFARLINPHGVEDFFARHYGQQHLHVRRTDPRYYHDVLDEDGLDRFLAQQDLNPARLMLVSQGTPIPPERWTEMKESLTGPFKTVLRTEKIFEFFHAGATIVANNAELTIPSLTQACGTFERETQQRVQANIYLTPPSSQGFSRHYDTHDIFVMQIRGAKQWRLYDTSEQSPLAFDGFSSCGELVEELTLNAGDLLYLPRGLTHEACAPDGTTIHVNFAIERRTGVDLIESLAKCAREDPFFRGDVPHILAGDARRESYVTEFAERLHALVEAHPPEGLLAARARDFAGDHLSDMRGRLVTALHLDALTVDSVVRRRPAVASPPQSDALGTIIAFAGQSLRIPKFVDPAPFLAPEEFRIGAVQGMVTDMGRVNLVRELACAGYLQIVML